MYFVIKSSGNCERPHPKSLLWYFEALTQTHDYGAQPEVLGGHRSWLICWYSQKADMATAVPGPEGAPPGCTGPDPPSEAPHTLPRAPFQPSTAGSPQGCGRAGLQLPTTLPGHGPRQARPTQRHCGAHACFWQG